jgi:NADPH:quinone reductase-like Zn-dependent oxidoreductase
MGCFGPGCIRFEWPLNCRAPTVSIREGGVLRSVLDEPEGAEKYDIRVEAFMAQPDASRLHQLADDAARHKFSIPIARTMKLQDIQEAHRIFERGGLSGKIVLVP